MRAVLPPSKPWTILIVLILCAGGNAYAELPDEIQVYDDGINAPGEFGLEMHLNRTPRGRSVALYPGELPPHRGTRINPELSYGLSQHWEAGLYLPVVRDPDGRWEGAAIKGRVKWIGKRSDGDERWFYGSNFELAKVRPRYEESSWGMEIRPIVGYRSADWLIAANPILRYALSPGQRQGGPEFSPAVKLGRKMGEGLSAGIETYSELGKLSTLGSTRQAQHTLYWVVDVDRGPWVFNVGIGRGLTVHTDRWTVKAIFDIPWPQ